MISVTVHLLGFDVKEASRKTFVREISEGTTVSELWNELKNSRDLGPFMSKREKKQIIVLLNDVAHSQNELWNRILESGSEVKFMVLAFGG